MRTLLLTEGERAKPCALTAAEAEAISVAELADVSRVPGATSWDVAARSKVGVANVGDLQIVVKPKIGIERLIFLMSYARRPSFWRDDPVLLDVDTGLADALAHAFGLHATKALDQGLLQGYRTVDEGLPVVRGRIRVGDQISRRYGRGLPLEVTYDEFTVDVAENQLLLAAVAVLLRMPTVSPGSRRVLQRLRLKLSDVTHVERGHAPTWVPSRLNARYHRALHLADLILAGDSFEQRVGDLYVTGFVFDMWKVFEDFVCIALAEAMRRHGGHATPQASLHLDDAETVAMRPDLLWTRHNGARVVVDAKYKAEQPSGFPQADLYQMLAYCTVLRLPSGHLVYAKGNEEPAVHSVQNSEVNIRCHTLDLNRSPDALLDQVTHLGESLVASSDPQREAAR